MDVDDPARTKPIPPCTKQVYANIIFQFIKFLGKSKGKPCISCKETSKNCLLNAFHVKAPERFFTCREQVVRVISTNNDFVILNRVESI